jgi:hypothetical protein
VIGGCLLLALLRFIIVPLIFGSRTPSLAEVTDETLGNVIATALAAAVLSAIVLWLTAPSRTSTELQVVHPKDIRHRLEQHFSSTRSWWFSGSAGRYNRARVLPELAKASRAANASREVVLLLLDPVNEPLCNTYAEFRRGVRTGKDGDWTVQRVRRDIYATVLAACVCSHSDPLLTVRVAIKQGASIFRSDLSDEQLVITREDPTEPALVCLRGSYFYEAFFEQMKYELRQARELDIAGNSIAEDSLDRARARHLLSELGLATQQALSDDELDAILEEVRSGRHPYA